MPITDFNCIQRQNPHLFCGFIIIAYFSSVIACVHILLSVERSATILLFWIKLFDAINKKT
ncbi:hypothetical protein PPBDW_I20954 [Photobacterium kishitanii]|nr:hypothetical protein PPBDW_I20954 [Photobacterium kishitanii]